MINVLGATNSQVLLIIFGKALMEVFLDLYQVDKCLLQILWLFPVFSSQ